MQEGLTVTRRQFFAAGVALATAPALGAVADRTVRVGLTPAFLHDQHALMSDWRLYLESRLERPVEFAQRDSYRETMDLLALEQIDFAWLCDYPYVHLRKQVRLLAVPLYQGRPYYHAYLIVSAKNPHVTQLLQLRGLVFAYADPYSNTGYLTPRYQLRMAGEDPTRFFGRTFFTYSHKKLVEAVADGLAHGASVDSFVWDTLNKLRPDITRRTRVVSVSPPYGFPPFVARHGVGQEKFAALQRVLLDMGDNPSGKLLLQRLNLDGFVTGAAELYESVAEMMRAFGDT